jgi:hypothetical protein
LTCYRSNDAPVPALVKVSTSISGLIPSRGTKHLLQLFG